MKRFHPGRGEATRFARLPVAAIYLFSFLCAACNYGDPFPLLGRLYAGHPAQVLVTADGLVSLYLFIGVLKRQRLTFWLLVAYNLFDTCNACVNLALIPIQDYARFAGPSFTQQSLRANTLTAVSLLTLLTVYVIAKRTYFNNRSPYLF